MKTYEIKDLLKKDTMLIELPENGNTFDDLTFLDSETEGYMILGKPDEISEEDAKELVQCINVGTTNKYVASVKFFNNVNNRYYKTATESLLSALETVIFWDVNPYKIYDLSTWHDVSKEYDAAELRTFDKSRTLIFVKQ